MRSVKVERGFSFVEIMIVIAIVAIIATLISINSSFLNGMLMRAEVEKLYNLCHYARRSAMVSNKECTIEFDIKNDSYRFGSQKEQLPRGIRFGFIDGAHGPPAHPKAPLRKPITFKGEHITFYPNGIIQSGTVYLVDDVGNTMYALSNAVSKVSYLRKYRYDGKWQLMD